jgi:hypothetical protein
MRSESSKCDLLKELRKKYENVVVKAADNEIFAPTSKELLRRLEVCELEKARLQSHSTALKTKIQLASEELLTLRTEHDRLVIIESKYEQLHASNQRKDLTAKSYKELAEKANLSLERMRKEYEKQQVDFSKEKR